jgi:N utilization substance protein B
MKKLTQHQHRIKLMQILFAYQFDRKTEDDLIESEDQKLFLGGIIPKLAEIDKIIQHHAKERPLKNIAKLDLAILRLIIFEKQEKETESKILINEAVELAKEFGDKNSYAFVNAVLEKILIKKS